MKWLVSDYDGTLKRFKGPIIYDLLMLKKDLYYIKKFINDGNKFVISTGRSYKSMHKEIVRNKIPFNYLTVNNGLVSFDEKSNIIYANYLEKKLIDDIKYLYKYFKILYNITTYNEYGFQSDYNIVKVKFLVNDFVKVIKECDLLRDKYNLDLYTLWNDFAIQKHSTKSEGIIKLIKSLNIEVENENIITVGNSTNDDDMISIYDGYYMFDLDSSLDYSNKKCVKSIKELIKCIKK